MTYGQGQERQDQSWEQRRYDLRGHTERLRRLQTPPQGQPSPQEPPWQQPGYGQQQRYPPPQQPRYAPPQPPAPEPPPPRTQNRTWKILAGLGGFVIVILAFAVAANRAAAHTASTTSYRDSGATVAATPAAASSASAGRVIATFTGLGIQSTAKFTVTATWKLDYTFDCSNLGGQGNFQVYEDGGSDTSVTVNALGTRDTASTYAYHDAGTHYLKINSECSWTVKVIDEGS
jgi:hypothetical protein